MWYNGHPVTPSVNLPFNELCEEDMDKKTKELVTCMFQFARNLAQEVGEGGKRGECKTNRTFHY